MWYKCCYLTGDEHSHGELFLYEMRRKGYVKIQIPRCYIRVIR